MEVTEFVYVVCSARARYEIEAHLKGTPIIATWLRPGNHIVALIQCPAPHREELMARLITARLGGRVFMSEGVARLAARERARL